MRKLIPLCCLLLSKLAFGQVIYVSGSGNDGNDGASEQTAFRNLQKAADVVKAGETVMILNGDYSGHGQGDTSAVLRIYKSGQPNAWITWKAAEGHHPVIHASGWNGIDITASYQVIDGLNIQGANDSLVLVLAQDDERKKKPDPKYNTNGISVSGRRRPPSNKPHHVTIRNCIIHDCPGGGVSGIETDYFVVEDCKIFNNAWYMRYGGSGISTLNNWTFDDGPGYHNRIERNYVWNNKSLVPWPKTGKLTDGNGIIMDVTNIETEEGATNPNADIIVNSSKDTLRQAAVKSKRPIWAGRTLIANNLCIFNGGSGIHTFRTAHVDIINNTTYHNGQVVGYQELFANRSDDIMMRNNIIIPRPGGSVTSNGHNTNISWDYNFYPKSQDALKGDHDIIDNPDFVNAGPDPLTGNFHLKRTSKAINSGSRAIITKKDITGKPRIKGPGIDRGAFEQ